MNGCTSCHRCGSSSDGGNELDPQHTDMDKGAGSVSGCVRDLGKVGQATSRGQNGDQANVPANRQSRKNLTEADKVLIQEVLEMCDKYQGSKKERAQRLL